MRYDVAVVGGGPAGLAAAIEARARGLSVIVLEKSTVPRDKACGEGLMPEGVHVLERLGVRALLSHRDCAPITALRYVQEDGTFAEARLPGGGGIGIRRVALSRAMTERARAIGVEVRERCEVRSMHRATRAAVLETNAGEIDASIVVAADGLRSPLRNAAGLDAPPMRGVERFGLRQHFRLAPWSACVEVHLAEGVEAYVTPVGSERVGVAFLWSRWRGAEAPSIAGFLGRFPLLAAKLGTAPVDSSPRGAGPFAQGARECVADRLVLLGDAAGYVDAITGEGLSLAFACAEALGRVLPRALASGATRASLAPYARAHREAFARYALVASGLVMLARRPWLRRLVVRQLGARPALFETVLEMVAAG